MSLPVLRQTRRAGDKPFGLVKVVIGRRIPALEGEPDVLTVIASDQPALMDWRPVVGLPCALFICLGCDALAEAVLEAVVAAHGALVGAVWADATVTSDEATAPVLRRMWEQLCP